MLKPSINIWCDYTETRCIRRVSGDNARQAMDFARLNGWKIVGTGLHLCPFHKGMK